jgi:hypothetical protein
MCKKQSARFNLTENLTGVKKQKGLLKETFSLDF